jgi:hypothetical protein
MLGEEDRDAGAGREPADEFVDRVDAAGGRADGDAGRPANSRPRAAAACPWKPRAAAPYGTDAADAAQRRQSLRELPPNMPDTGFGIVSGRAQRERAHRSLGTVLGE